MARTTFKVWAGRSPEHEEGVHARAHEAMPDASEEEVRAHAEGILSQVSKCPGDPHTLVLPPKRRMGRLQSVLEDWRQGMVLASAHHARDVVQRWPAAQQQLQAALDAARERNDASALEELEAEVQKLKEAQSLAEDVLTKVQALDDDATQAALELAVIASGSMVGLCMPEMMELHYRPGMAMRDFGEAVLDTLQDERGYDQTHINTLARAVWDKLQALQEGARRVGFTGTPPTE